MKQLGIIIIGLLLLCSCGRQSGSIGDEGDTLHFKYAEKITVVRYDGFTLVSLANPWKKGKILHDYVLVPRNQELPHGLPHGTIVRTPLSKSLLFTTVHSALLMMLHQEKSIAGVADLRYIKIPFVQEGVQQGRIRDCGDSMSPSIEQIIDLHPDAILLSPFENNGGYGKLEDIEIPIIECAEYMEKTPLARAEWMRFYGMLFGCEHEADSLFAVTDSSYHALKQMAQEAEHVARNVVLDKMTGNVWYVPGGQSTIGQMLHDAGGGYPWEDDEHSGSVSLPFETVLEKAGDCDLWMLRYSGEHPLTYAELAREHHGYNQFKAFYENQVYGCNVENSQFFEESPFRPDFLLGDFIHILHPETKGVPPLRYYHKLTD